MSSFSWPLQSYIIKIYEFLLVYDDRFVVLTGGLTPINISLSNDKNCFKKECLHSFQHLKK